MAPTAPNVEPPVHAPSLLHHLVSRDGSPNYQPGLGAHPPETFNNKGWFALFGLLGAAMVVVSIWFFFWAKNGGFVWRKHDWDDYKSTVLRRKGPDGKTLSNATPRTNLGQNSVAGSFEYQDEKHESRKHRRSHKTSSHSGSGDGRSSHKHHKREHKDADVAAYRRERPARVGGLNRTHDGSHFDYSNTDRSDIMSNTSRTPLKPSRAPEMGQISKKKGFMEKKREQREVKKQQKKQQKDEKTRHKSKPVSAPAPVPEPSRQRRYSFTTVDDSTVADTAELYGGSQQHDSYYDEYRPQMPAYAARVSSPRRHAPRRGQAGASTATRTYPKPPSSFDAYSEAGTSDTGTKTYSHHIPNTSKPKDSGFRRGGRGGRRDSLSDSD